MLVWCRLPQVHHDQHGQRCRLQHRDDSSIKQWLKVAPGGHLDAGSWVANKLVCRLQGFWFPWCNGCGAFANSLLQIPSRDVILIWGPFGGHHLSIDVLFWREPSSWTCVYSGILHIRASQNGLFSCGFPLPSFQNGSILKSIQTTGSSVFRFATPAFLLLFFISGTLQRGKRKKTPVALALSPGAWGFGGRPINQPRRQRGL